MISRISRSIKRIKSEEMAEFHLKGTHVSCLYYLSLADGQTAAQLCERCDEDKAAISRSLDFLEKQGYISCQSSLLRRYKSPLKLTPSGWEICRIIHARIARIVSEAGGALSDAERENMYHALNIISGRLEQLGTKNLEEQI